MSQWLRWYAGTAEDSKFRIIARSAKSSVPNVIAIWAIVLESASDDAHRGICTRETEDFAVILDLDDEEVVRVLDAMQVKGLAERIESGLSVVSWGARQFEGDRDPTAADRQRKRREKLKSERDSNACHGTVTRDSHGVTVESRPPDTDTDTDTDTSLRSVSSADHAAPCGDGDEDRPMDLKERLFGPALTWLAKQTKKPPDKLRSIVGKWCSEYGDSSVLDAINAAHRNSPLDPVPYVIAALGGKKNGKAIETQPNNCEARAAGIVARIKGRSGDGVGGGAGAHADPVLSALPG